MKEIGLRLREARESKGLTIEAASEQTKIRALYLQALEDGEFEKLPGKVYVKGFIRTYSSILDIDPSDLIKQYQGYLEQESEEETPVLSEVTVLQNKGSKVFKKILIFLIILALLAAGFYFVKNTWLTIKNETIPQLLEPEANQQLVSPNPSGTDQDVTDNNNSDKDLNTDLNNDQNTDLPRDNAMTQLDSTNSSNDQDTVSSADGEMIENSPIAPNEVDNSAELSDEEPSLPADDFKVANATTDESTEDSQVTEEEQNEPMNQTVVDTENTKTVPAVDSNTNQESELTQNETDYSITTNTPDESDVTNTQGEELTSTKNSAENSTEPNNSPAASDQKEDSDSIITDIVAKNDEDIISSVQDSDDTINQDVSYVRDEERWQNYEPSESSTTVVNNLAVPEEEPQQKPAVETSIIQVYASQNSWIRVTIDEEVVFQDIMYKGESKLFKGEKIRLRINNAAAITVNYQGILLGPFGKKDELVEKVFGE